MGNAKNGWKSKTEWGMLRKGGKVEQDGDAKKGQTVENGGNAKKGKTIEKGGEC